MANEKKEKKIVFSEKIDEAINGYSVGLTFISISVFIFFKTDYFSSPQISYIVGGLFGVIGVIGCGIEISKSIKLKGTDNFFVGIFFLVLWSICYSHFNAVWVNIITIFALVIGCYGVIRGTIEIAYSVISSAAKDSRSGGKTASFKNMFLFLTQLFGLILTILNILKIFGAIDTNGG